MARGGKILFVCAGFENLSVGLLSSYLKARGHQTALLFYPATFSGAFGPHVPPLDRCTTRFKRRLVARARQIDPQLVAFSAFTLDFQWCLEMARLLKRALGVPVVFGGPHCTAAPEAAAENSELDALVVGEGEQALAEIADSVVRDGAIDPGIENLCLRQGGAVQKNPVRGYLADLDSLPFTDKDLFCRKVRSFSTDYMLMTSRGCPYSCRYCINWIYRRLYAGERAHIRRRSVEHVIAELRWATARYPIQRINFMDDLFIFDLPWLERFVEQYQRYVKLPFICFGHPLFVKDEAIALIKRAGCIHMRTGVESASPETLSRVLGRRGGPDDVLRAGEVFRRHGLAFSVDHMLGLPTEGAAEQEAAALLYSRLRPNRVNTYWLNYYPGTQIIQEALSLGLLDEHDVEQINQGQRVGSFNYPSNDYYPDRQMSARFQTLFDLLPFLSERSVRRMVRTRAWRFLPTGSPLRHALQLLNDLKEGDTRATVIGRYVLERKDVP
jgi:radical SAM superfamily enzyme YgiQ (UPF0313 family)